MEECIFQSDNKETVIKVKNLLENAGIPVTDILLVLHYMNSRGQGNFWESREKLIVPLENFIDELNEFEFLEIYIDSEQTDAADTLIFNFLNAINDQKPILLSFNYNEAKMAKEFLTENNFPCKEIEKQISEDGITEYMVFVEEKYYEKACEFFEEHNSWEKFQTREPFPKKKPRGKYSRERTAIFFILVIVFVTAIFIAFYTTKYLFR